MHLKTAKNNRSACDVYAWFVYAVLIVDFYRKFSANVVKLPLAANTFRNIVYVILFLAVLLSERRLWQYVKLLVISGCFLLMTAISWLINWERNATDLFIDLVFMFFSRLLPAFYIGTMIIGQEKAFVASINKLQIFTIAYSVLIMLYPEVSQSSYLTISGNLLLPALLGLFNGQKGAKSLIPFAAGGLGLLVILLYGGRTSLVAVVLAIGLILLVRILNSNSRRKILAVMGILLASIMILVLYQDILDLLLQMNPNSRTLKLLAKGEFFWMSNREGYYKAALDSIFNHPLRVYGFLGDRFYYADTFGTAGDNSVIGSMFSHNVMLELLLNFGVLIGLVIIVYFISKAVASVRALREKNDAISWNVFIILFACAFAPLFISSSWLNDYTIWLMAGAIIGLSTRRKNAAYS